MFLPPCRCTCPATAAVLTKMMQVRKFVVRREVQPKKEGAKPYTKAPRIQRLVTPQRLQHKRHLKALKRRQYEAQKEAAVRHTSVVFLPHTRLYTRLARRAPKREACMAHDVFYSSTAPRTVLELHISYKPSLTPLFYSPSTPSFSTSVLARRRPSKPRSASAVRPA